MRNAGPVRADPGVIVFIVVAEIALTIGFVSPWFPMASLVALERASGGWLSVTLLVSSGFGGFGVWLAWRFARQRLVDLGWIARDLAPALVVLVATWLVLQAVAVLAAEGPVVAAPPVVAQRWGLVFGPLLAQLFGTALMEETLYRAFLWRQLELAFGSSMPPLRARIGALLVSQAIFAVMHIPIRIYQGAALQELGGMLLMLLASGLVLAAVYAATRNLFVAVAIHALANAPTLVVAAAGPPPSVILLAISALLCIAWPLARRGRPRSVRWRSGLSIGGLPLRPQGPP